MNYRCIDYCIIRFSSGTSPHFAISPINSPAELYIHTAAFPGATPAVLTLGLRPLRISDFDFVDADKGLLETIQLGRGPRVAAGVGRSLLVFWVGEE